LEPYKEEDRKRLESRINKFRKSERGDGGWSPWQGLSLLGSLGLSVGVCITAGIWLGSFLDRKFHFTPWLTITGLFLGLLAAGKIGYELIKSTLKGGQ